MQVPSKAELERFFSEEQSEEVQFLEIVATWPSLRILEYLYENEPTTTAALARGVNMDMRDVKDRLEALEKHGIVSRKNDNWRSQTEKIQMEIRKTGDQLELSHAIGPSSEPTDASDAGIVSRLIRSFNPFN
jgi:DNA-binding MarR family transcriptional regulator